MINTTVSYAQNREDIIINAFFDNKPKGFYVDVGANHPVQDSVTKLFYEKGWRGINIEPNQDLLKEIKYDRPEDINLGVGVGEKEAEAVLRQYTESSGLSTVSEEVKNAENIYYDELKKKYVDIKISIKSLKTIFSEQESLPKIDFMKIDVEGLEYDVIKGNDWSKFRPELICIESDHVIKDWRPLLKNAKYIKFFNDGLNDYYATEESELREKFSYPSKILMQYPKIVPFLGHANTQDIKSEDLDFLEPTESPKAFASASQQIKWSLVGLRAGILGGLQRTIIKNKRQVIRSSFVARLNDEAESVFTQRPKAPRSLKISVLKATFFAVLCINKAVSKVAKV